MVLCSCVIRLCMCVITWSCVCIYKLGRPVWNWILLRIHEILMFYLSHIFWCSFYHNILTKHWNSSLTKPTTWKELNCQNTICDNSLCQNKDIFVIINLLHIYLVVISFYTICSLLLILMWSVIQFSRWTWIILHSMAYVLLFEHSIGSFKCCMFSNPSCTEIELNIACMVLIMKDMCRIT